jgi:hypothetical protein
MVNQKLIVYDQQTIPYRYFAIKISLETFSMVSLYLIYNLSDFFFYILGSVIFSSNFIGLLIVAPHRLVLSIDEFGNIVIIKSHKILLKIIKIPYVLNNFIIKDYRLIAKKTFFLRKKRYLFVFKISAFTYKLVLTREQLELIKSMTMLNKL